MSSADEDALHESDEAEKLARVKEWFRKRNIIRAAQGKRPFELDLSPPNEGQKQVEAELIAHHKAQQRQKSAESKRQPKNEDR